MTGLRRANLRTLRDLSAVSIDQLLALPHIGAQGIQRLAVLMDSAGLSFQAPADPTWISRHRVKLSSELQATSLRAVDP